MSEEKPTVKKIKVRKPRPAWILAIQAFFNMLVVALNILAGLGLLCSGYAHAISPLSMPIITVTAMTFPVWFGAVILVFILDLIWWPRTAWIPGIAMLMCLGPIRDFSPLNIPRFRMTATEKERAFTLMTYNVYAWHDYRDKAPAQNRQMDYILKLQPDVVCIQEATYLAPIDGTHITQEQLEQLHLVYPYVLTQGENFAIFSKFKTQPINLDFPAEDFSSGDMAAWRLFIDGQVVNVFSVHLRSFGLTQEDKGAYQDIVKFDDVTRDDLRDARQAILPKLKKAAVERAEQIEYLQKYLAKYGGPNAIVCGDFNDPVLCYGLSQLEEGSHMQQVYAQVGFGPAITYNANNLYFRIDHVLYRGNLYPYKIKRCGINASDHYPLLTTFILKDRFAKE